MSEPLKLAIGGDVPDGFTLVDRKSDKGAFPLQYADESVDEIRACHTLQFFSHRDTGAVLREWHRVLKPGGRMRLAVPDADWIARKTLERDGRYPIEGYMMGAQKDASDYHRASFNVEGLKSSMLDTGLRRIRRWKDELLDCASLPVSLNLEGHKPAPVEIPSTLAVMSLPRVTWTENFACAVSVLPKLGIQLRPYRGVFWHHSLTRGLDAAIDEGHEYAMTLDYDSVFAPEHVIELYRVMNDHPEVDALCCTEIGRESGAALITMHNSDGSYRPQVPMTEFDGDLTRITTGHFGLTLLRTSALKDLPRPWFVESPGAEGRFGKDRIDCDVAFWHKWKAAGKSLYVANWCNIGQIETVITWPTETLGMIQQKATEWGTLGAPIQVRR